MPNIEYILERQTEDGAWVAVGDSYTDLRPALYDMRLDADITKEEHRVVAREVIARSIGMPPASADQETP